MIRDAALADARVLALVLGDWVRETGWMPVRHTREEDLGFVEMLIRSSVVRMAADGGGFLSRQGGEVDALYLAPPARGRGLGKRLLDEAKAAEPELWLWTFQANSAARRFYAREGFVEVASTDGSGNDEQLPDVRLHWRRDAG